MSERTSTMRDAHRRRLAGRARTEPKGRAAFTLVELLVVIAIIGILIGLLVPAVQKVRASSQRTQCSNNLHQIGIAVHGYYTDFKAFPAAFKSPGNQPGWGWGTMILPYVEQRALYDQLNPLTTAFTLNPTANTATPLSIFRCTADTSSGTNPYRYGHGTSNYRATCGPGTVNWTGGTVDMGGVMYQNSTTRTRNITDGTSNTSIIAECVIDQPTTKWGAIWAGFTGLSSGQGRYMISDVMWNFDAKSAINGGSVLEGWGSRHSGGGFFLFADGSCRFVREGGDLDVIRYIAGRNDGVAVDLDGL